MSASERTELVRQVADLIASGEWSDEWGEELGVTPDMVRAAAELVADAQNVDSVMRAATWGLTQIAREARRAGDFSAAVSALANLARVTGATAPDRVEVNDARELESMRAELMGVAARHPEMRAAMVRALGGRTYETADGWSEAGGEAGDGLGPVTERTLEAEGGPESDVDG